MYNSLHTTNILYQITYRSKVTKFLRFLVHFEEWEIRKYEK